MATRMPDAAAVSPPPRSGRGRWGRAARGLALALVILGPSCWADTIRVATWNIEGGPGGSRTNAAAGTNKFPAQAAASQKQNAAAATDAGRTNAAVDRSEWRIRQAANALKRLNPDVILLQQVRDWETCDELAQALKPDKYEVLICSSFRVRTGVLGKQQVAILARRTAYFSWSETWRGQGKASGGFAFAALQVGQRRVGFFSVEAGFPTSRAADPAQSTGRQQALTASVNQLLDQAGSVANWLTNRVQGLVVGGTFDPGAQDELAAQDPPLRLLERAGFSNALMELSAEERVTRPGKAGAPDATVDYIFTQPTGSSLNPRIIITPAFAHRPVMCDVEIASGNVIAAPPPREAPRSAQSKPDKKAEPEPAQVARVAPPTPPRPAAAAAPPRIPNPTAPPQVFTRPLVTAAALGGMGALAAMAWLLARRMRTLPRRTPALLVESVSGLPSSYTVVLGTRSATEPAPAEAPRPIVHIETPGATHTHAEVLRQRALAAEQRAERATAVIRAGLIPHLRQWLKQKLVRNLVADRAQLMETQQAATFKALNVEERLARVEQQIQRQNSAYQERIETLTRELLAAKEENREIIRARIAQVKAEMAAARAKLMAQTEPDGAGGA